MDPRLKYSGMTDEFAESYHFPVIPEIFYRESILFTLSAFEIKYRHDPRPI